MPAAVWSVRSRMQERIALPRSSMFWDESHWSPIGQPLTVGGCDGRCAAVERSPSSVPSVLLGHTGGSVAAFFGSIGTRPVLRMKPITCSTGFLTMPARDAGEKNASDLNRALSSGFSS